MLFLPAIPEVIAAFVAEAEAAPEQLSTIASVMPAPPLPFLAPEHHGRLVVMATLVYAGDVGAGQRAVAPFRALATPVADMLRPTWERLAAIKASDDPDNLFRLNQNIPPA